MDNQAETDRNDAVRGLFALITARLEDAHDPSIKGQSEATSKTEMLALLDQIASCRGEIATLEKAIKLLLARESSAR
ncbi:MAG: hypothetical protein ABJ239_03400 [Erythrobacter sp.]